MKHLFILILFLFFFSSNIFAQEKTVGLLNYDPALAYDGYNLLYPHNQPNVYLLNNCGEVVHKWEDDPGFRPGNTAYLQEDGRIIKCKRPAGVAGNPIWAGGGGGTVEIRDWDNNLEWSFTINDSLARLHHDIAPMPNGNILMIVWELKTEAEAIQAGRDTSKLVEGELWPDYIIEVNPTSNEIVWEWHAWDHLIQDYDATKDNYGVVADHPELININWDTNEGKADWHHSNAIDYMPERDQIILSVPTFHEIWVIDHTTTTEEAAGHTGGFSGKGGDLVYRWGNPAAYDKGDSTDQKLFYQHDTHVVDDYLDFNHPQFGKIALFNNRVEADVSTVNVINPPFDMYEWTYPLEADGTFGPSSFDLTIKHPEPTRMHSTGLSSVQFLPNGNTLICVGRWGYVFELTPTNEIVWEYITPQIKQLPATQGDTLAMNDNLTFRVSRIPSMHPAFAGKDLSSQGYLELNPDSTYCGLVLSTAESFENFSITVFPNPASDELVMEWKAGRYADIEIIDLNGRVRKQFMGMGGRRYMSIADLEKGMYIVRINKVGVKKLIITE